MSLSRQQIDSISIQVYSKFPELEGIIPKVKTQSIQGADPTGQSQSKGLFDGQYLLTYMRKTSIAGGNTMMRVVRAVSDSKGKILKITTSK